MREFRFRVWYKGQMIYRNPGMSFHEFMITPDGCVFIKGEPGKVNGEGHSAILLQWTGLKDKNAVEIYEGDIVKWDDGSGGKYWRVAVVYWDEDECLNCFKCVENTLHPLSTQKGYVFGGNFANRDKRSAARNLILVGNIYETPELLKQ